VQVRFSLFLIATDGEVVTARKEEVEGDKTLDINDRDEAQPVISQFQGVTSIWLWCRILRRFFVLLQDPGEATSLR
jgi:hypothetical protein